MKQNAILTLAVVALVGCAVEEAPTPTAERAEPLAEQPAEPPAEAPEAARAAEDAPGDEAAPSAGIAGIAGVAEREAPDGAPQIEAADFDLGKVSAALEAHRVKDGEALERYINDRDNGITRVDVDGDGTVDVIRIDEKREAEATAFEIRAVPSSAKRADDGVIIAVVRIRPERRTRRIVVVSRYTDVVIVHDHRHEWRYVETVDFDDDGLLVIGPGQVFFGWLFAVRRPVFHSVVIDLGHRHHHRTVVEVIDDCWPPGHCKHGKRYSKGKYAKRYKGKYGKRHKRHKRGKYKRGKYKRGKHKHH